MTSGALFGIHALYRVCCLYNLETPLWADAELVFEGMSDGIVTDVFDGGDRKDEDGMEMAIGLLDTTDTKWHDLFMHVVYDDSPRLMRGLELFTRIREPGIVACIVGFTW